MPFFVERMTALLPTTLVAERHGAIVAFSAWKSGLLGQIFVRPLIEDPELPQLCLLLLRLRWPKRARLKPNYTVSLVMIGHADFTSIWGGFAAVR